MNEARARRLQSWFDGEVSATECGEIESLLERDAQARDFVKGLSRTREALQEAHAGSIDVEGTWGEFLEKLNRSEQERASRVLSFPQVMAAAAAVMALGIAVWLPFRQAGDQAARERPLGATVEMVETDLEGATPIVYIDQPSGWTVVWVLEEEPEES
ncbi:MAG: anti-sigma factor family protein [Oceanipulchritudo sp.]